MEIHWVLTVLFLILLLSFFQKKTGLFITVVLFQLERNHRQFGVCLRTAGERSRMEVEQAGQ